MSSIGSISSGTSMSVNLSAMQGAGATAAPAVSGGEGIQQGGMSSISSTSTMQSMIASSGAAANQDMMAAMLLMLTLEFMKGEDSDKRKDILGLMAGMLQQAGGAGGESTVMMFSSTQTTMQSSETQLVASGAGIAAYGASMGATSQVPGADAGSAGLDVMA